MWKKMQNLHSGFVQGKLVMDVKKEYDGGSMLSKEEVTDTEVMVKFHWMESTNKYKPWVMSE